MGRSNSVAEIVVDGGRELIPLALNGVPVPFDGLPERDADDPRERHFTLAHNEHAQEFGPQGGMLVELERTYRVSRSVRDEPHLMGIFKRFVEGLTIKGKIDGGYRLFFTRTGLHHPAAVPEPDVDADGFACGMLAPPGSSCFPDKATH
jgi:hypothetical protein